MRLHKSVIPFLLFLFVLTLYIHNLSRSVYGGDVGDLVTAAFVGGVPHPPGYPLFTLLGFLLTRFTFITDFTPAFMVGLISAVSSSGAVLLLYLTAYRLTKNSIVSIIGALTLAFTYLFWFYAEIAEVFALNNFFALLLLYLALLYREKGTRKLLYILAFSLGLSLTNHHTIILLFPSILILCWSQLQSTFKTSLKSILIAAFFGLLGFSVYGYVIIASMLRPVIDWAHITDIKSFTDLLLRERYGTFSAGNFPSPPPMVRAIILRHYVETILIQITIPVITFSALGFLSLFRKDRIAAVAIFLGFFLTGPFFITYAGFPLTDAYRFGVNERFLSLSTVILLLFFPVGIAAFSSFLGRFFSQPLFTVLFQLIFILIPLQLFIFNFPKTNLSDLWIGDTLAYDQLRTAPKNAIIFLSGDTNLFNSWYVRYALGFREDVTVLNPLSPDYANEHLSRRHSGIKSGADTSREATLQLLENMKKLDISHPVISDVRYTDPSVQLNWIPHGMNFILLTGDDRKLTLEEFREQSKKIWNTYRLPTENYPSLVRGSYTVSDIHLYYSNGLIATANFFMEEYTSADDAERYYRKALETAPDYERAMVALGVFLWTTRDQCAEGIDFIENAIEADPTEKRFYQLAYIAHSECKTDKSNRIRLQQLYVLQFGSSLLEDLKKYYSDDKNEK